MIDQPKPKARRCKCQLCVYGRKVRKMLKTMNPEQKAFVEQMYENLCGADADVDYYRAILDGSWPQAEEILANALVKARRVKIERDLPDDIALSSQV